MFMVMKDYVTQCSCAAHLNILVVFGQQRSVAQRNMPDNSLDTQGLFV